MAPNEELIRVRRGEVREAERLLEVAHERLREVLRSDTEVEELARVLWVEVGLKSEIQSSYDQNRHEGEESERFYEEVKADKDKRDSVWDSLMIESERDEWRALARRVIELRDEFLDR